MNTKSFFTLIGLFIAAMAVSSSVYIVTEYERAVVLRSGRLQNIDVPPGLHCKIPFADRVRKFDGRLMTAAMRPESFFTIENKRLIVDSYIKWRVKNVENYYKATGGDEDIAAERLAQRVADGLRNQFGRRTLHEVV